MVTPVVTEAGLMHRVGGVGAGRVKTVPDCNPQAGTDAVQSVETIKSRPAGGGEVCVDLANAAYGAMIGMAARAALEQGR